MSDQIRLGTHIACPLPKRSICTVRLRLGSLEMRVFSTKAEPTLQSLAVLLALLLVPCASMRGLAEPVTSSSDIGTVWWNELVTVNPERSREFYVGVIGWTPRIVAADDSTRPPNPDEADYTYFMQNTVESAGLTKFESDEPVAPKPGWLTYIQVGNVDDAVTEAVRRGGKVLKAPYNAKNTGRLAVIEDPDGNAVGLFSQLSIGTVPQP